MTPEEIKVGETYNVRVKVEEKTARNTINGVTILPNGKKLAKCVFFDYEIAAFFPINAESGIKNTETAPKYDPCRLFKKGDRVRLKREINGRLLKHCFFNFAYNEIYTIKEDEVQKECQSGHVTITDGEHNCTLCFYELELVTPVEELEPYVVRLATPDGVEEWHVEPRNNNLALVAVYGNAHPHAKEAAEAECKRLNEEYRKEQQ